MRGSRTYSCCQCDTHAKLKNNQSPSYPEQENWWAKDAQRNRLLHINRSAAKPHRKNTKFKHSPQTLGSAEGSRESIRLKHLRLASICKKGTCGSPGGTRAHRRKRTQQGGTKDRERRRLNDPSKAANAASLLTVLPLLLLTAGRLVPQKTGEKIRWLREIGRENPIRVERRWSFCFLVFAPSFLFPLCFRTHKD